MSPPWGGIGPPWGAMGSPWGVMGPPWGAMGPPGGAMGAPRMASSAAPGTVPVLQLEATVQSPLSPLSQLSIAMALSNIDQELRKKIGPFMVFGAGALATRSNRIAFVR